MKERISALLVHAQDNPFGALESVLASSGIRISHARTFQEVLSAFDRSDPPQLDFTDTSLPDGTWTDVLEFIAKVKEVAGVIVVSRLVDINLYIQALENGAADFIVPPFHASDMGHVVRSATASRAGAKHSPTQVATG